MTQAPDENETVLPPSLRVLKGLVIALTATMIVGVIVVVALLVIRFPSPGAGLTALPASITLPAGAAARAFTAGPDWYAVVTDDDRILIFDAASGALRQSVAIAPGAPAN